MNQKNRKMKKTLLVIATVMSFGFAISQETTNQYFKVEVKGSGSPMILIPGLTCPGEVWSETVSEFKKEYQCHIISLAGFAGIPAVDYGNSYTEKMSNKLIEYIKSNKIDKPVVTGHSLGGFIALKMAIKEPELIGSSIIVDALPFLPAVFMPGATIESAKPMAENIKKTILTPMEDDAFRTQQRSLLKTMIIDEKKIETALQWSVDSDNQTVADAMYDLYSTDLRESLVNVKSPILVLGAWIAYKNYGATRALNMATYKAQYSKAKDVTVDMTDTGNHFIMWDDPQFFYTQVRTFLASK